MSWTLDAPLVAMLVLAAAVYVRGWRRLHALRPDLYGTRPLLAYLGGLATLAIAIGPPLDALADLLLQVHMLQHALLTMLAPPLLLLGRPVPVMLRGLPRRVRQDALGPFLASPGLQRLGRGLVHPVSGLLAFTATTWLWHLPAAYELALRSPGWHALEHAAFVGAAILFWWPVVDVGPARSPWPRAAMIPWLVLADLQNTAFSALFAFSDRVFYPSYAAAPRLLGSALDDQGSAGALMWVASSSAFLVAIAAVVRDVLQPEVLRRARPAREPRSAVAPRPRRAGRVVARFLTSLGFRRAAQTLCLALAAAVVLDGLLGPAMSPMNLAGVLPWTYGRGLLVLGLLALGNVFCFACPFMLVRDAGRRLLPGAWRWPRQLRSKWLAAGLLAASLVVYEVADLWDRPALTAIFVLGYFGAAFAVDGLFRGAAFCRYVCPIGQFQFLASTVSPLEVKVASPATCATCTTHDCIRGNDASRGCELSLFAPAKVGNLDCTFCLDCVRACPHGNVGVAFREPVRELADGRPRASFGRLPLRTDVAALALVFVAGAFANAAAMVGPVVRGLDALGAALGSLAWARALALAVALTLAPLAAVSAAAILGRTLAGRSALALVPLGVRFTLALVPLGVALWAAHLLFHLGSGATSLVPVVQRVALGLGTDLLGLPDWSLAHGSGSGALLSLGILLLDVGLLATLLTGWRVAERLAPPVGRALRLFAPFALLALLAFALALWILVQPMEMRGTMLHG